MPPAAAYALQQATNALALGSVYALLATAYALVYGLIGRLNLAFGEVAVAGGFATVVAAMAAAWSGIAGLALAVLAGLALAAATSALWSWAISHAVLMPLHAAHRPGQPILVATVALAIALQEGLRLAQGAQDRWLPPFLNAPVPIAGGEGFVATITTMQVLVVLLAVAACGGVLALMARSRFGRAWRACADDPGMAALLGVRLDRLAGATALLAGLLAGLGGFVVAVYYGGVTFSMGTSLGLKALVAAVLGGIGSLRGAFVGGFLVALIETAWSARFDIAWRDVVVFSLIGVLFLLRPGGLFGFAGPRPRDI